MIIFSDFHADSHSEFSKPWKFGCNTRLKSHLDVLSNIFELAFKEGDKTIVFLGDWFHRWRAVDTTVSSMVSSTLYSLLNNYPETRMIMMPGNHDMPNKNVPSVSTISSYSAHPRITLVDSPSKIRIEDQGEFVFIPYFQDHTVVRDEALRLSKNSKDSWLFAHLDIIGAVAGIDGYVSPGGVNLEDLSSFAGGVFGHYHMPQEFSSVGGDSFYYVGAPLQISWADEKAGHCAEEVRGVIRLHEGKIRRIPLDSPKFVKVSADYKGDVRDKDYYLVECSPLDADDVYAEWSKKIGDSSFFRVVATEEKKDDRSFLSSLTDNEDAISSYTKARAHLCECDVQTVLNYGNYYYRGSEDEKARS